MISSILLVGLGAPEIILIVLALLLLFGGKKIPELMRGLGRGVKEFKEAKDGDPVVTKDSERRDI
jgi:sec-independent protein translocase protein TatA